MGAKFRLRDYQVVNGCQTSHVLYLARSHLSEHVYLPLKLIVTSDVDVTNQIIRGANRQTEIKPEAFESLAPFQTELEETYIAVSKSLSNQVVYERRSKQYEDFPISRDFIITLPAQIKCFVGMFLNEPHSTHRYYGELLDSYRSRLFSESHRYLPYVVSGIALAEMERFFTDEKLSRSLKHYRFQLLMAFRLRFGKGGMPALNSKSMDDYCRNLLAIINDSDRYVSALNNVAMTINKIQSEGTPWKEPPERTRSFTSAIVEQVTSFAASEPAHTDRLEGMITEFSRVKGFGYIASLKAGGKVFFHQSDSHEDDVREVKMLDRVSFVVADGRRGKRAVDVKITTPQR